MSAAIDAPRPPFLVLRPGIAFWVQDKPVEAAAATPQALEQRPIAWNRCAVPPIGHKLL